MTLTAADIQGADLCEPLALFGIAIQKVPGKHSRQRPSAGSHSSQTRYAISLSYLDHLEIGGRAVRSGAAGAARAAPLFLEKFVIIARVHSLLSGTTPH